MATDGRPRTWVFLGAHNLHFTHCGRPVSLGSWAAEWPHMAREMVAGRSYMVWCYTMVVKITVWLQMRGPGLGFFWAPTICISLIVGAEVSLGSWAAEWPHMAREMVAGRSYVVWCYTMVVKITVWLQLVRPRTWAFGVPTICISLNV